MYRFITLVFFLFVSFYGTANAALIEYEFDTLTFTDDHQINGGFTYNTAEDRLVALSLSLFGPTYNIDFNMDDLTGPDAFSIGFDNLIYGDAADEGFQVFRDDVLVATGYYGLGDNDTCFFDPQTCTNTLFRFTSDALVVDAPRPAYLLILGLVLLLRKRIFQFGLKDIKEPVSE